MKNYVLISFIGLVLVGCAAVTSFEPPASFGPRDQHIRSL